MPPKFDPNEPAVVELVSLFKSFGLSETKSLEAVRNPKTAAALKDIVQSCNLSANPLDDKQSGLIASLASQGSKLAEPERNYIAVAVADGGLRSADQLGGTPVNCEKLGGYSISDICSCCQVSDRASAACR
jgi:glutaminyl-tRNA synthetase